MQPETLFGSILSRKETPINIPKYLLTLDEVLGEMNYDGKAEIYRNKSNTLIYCGILRIIYGISIACRVKDTLYTVKAMHLLQKDRR